MSGIPAGAGSLLGKRLGKYEILALLALGGTAEIYLARIDGSHGFEKFVVVKCLHEHLADDMEFVKMFLDEARLAAHLDHSNIVQTYELGEHENRYYMVMEFLAGLSLAMVVRRASERLPGGRIPVPLTLNMIAQAAAGLHYAHEKTQNGKPLNIVHRDISPQNLVVSFEGVTKVVDFGIAKAEHRETRTRSGTIKGKFAYMSPEQCVANNVDRRTDVFALGVIAHELLTGRRLFKRPSPYETYQAVIECNVAPPSAANHELDPALDPVIMRSVAKDKEQRYPTAEAFGDAIQAYLHHRGKSSGPGDVGRFFDASFGPEIEEHGARMRELIEGREAALALKGGGWGDEEDDAKKSKRQDATVDVRSGRGGDQSIDLNSQDLEVMRGSQASLDSMISGLDSLGPPGASRQSGRIPRITEPDPDPEPGDEDDMPPDRTRIESNPLEQPQPERPSRPSHGAMPLPAPPTGPHPAARSGKFPDAATLPTMIAGPDAPAGAATGDAPTAISQPLDPSRLASKAAERPSYGQNVQLSPSMQHAAVEPRPSALAMLNQPPGGAAPGRGNGAPGTPPRGHAQQQPPQPPGTPPSGIAAQRPSGDSGPQAQQQMQQQQQQMQQQQQQQQQMQQQQQQQMQQQQQQQQQMQQQQMQPPPGYPQQSQSPPHGYPQQLQSPPHGYPPQQQLQSPPHGYPQQQGYPMHGANGQQGIPDSGVYVDPQHAANMMSPVGNQYPQRDWDTAAAAPATAMPTWKLAVLFIGMVGIALTLTIIIAHIAR